jgi:hypothetical protein
VTGDPEGGVIHCHAVLIIPQSMPGLYTPAYS